MFKVTYTTARGKKNSREFSLEDDAKHFAKEAKAKGWTARVNKPKPPKTDELSTNCHTLGAP